MATHKSAEKRYRQSVKKRVRNRTAKATVKSAIKSARVIAEQGGDVQTAVRSAESLIAKAASKKILPKGRASRQISRLVKKAAKQG